MKIRSYFTMYATVIVAVWCIFFWTSCKKSSIPPADIDQSYFPLQSGKYIIYDVDSIVFSNFFDTTDTAQYQVMEQADSPYIDASDNQAFRIVRSRRNNENDQWQITDIWSTNLTENTAEKVEENLRFVKMNFPVLLNKTWKGNTYINTDSPLVYLSDWDYQYTEVNVSLQIEAILFDSVVTVTQHDDENAIQKILYLEKYAKHVGLIYKEEQNIETQPGQYPDGYILRMAIREFN